MVSKKMLADINSVLIKTRHYVDEEKAYDSAEFVKLLRDIAGLDTLERYAESFSDEDAQKLILDIQKDESRLVAKSDPKALRVKIWGNNGPANILRDQEWPGSPDGEDFEPFVIPYCIEDGKKHPAIINISGGKRTGLIEGDNYCKYFNSIGFHAFQLGQRVENGHTGAVVANAALDLQRAIRFLRYNAERFMIDKELIFAIGSSLGGVTIVHYIEELLHEGKISLMDNFYIDDDVDKESDKISGMIGIYTSSYPNSLRKEGINYCNYPPVFAVLGGSDWTHKYQMHFFNELIQHGVIVELHLFNGAIHGFGMGDNKRSATGDGEIIKAVSKWPELASLWLERVKNGSVYPKQKEELSRKEELKEFLNPTWPGYQEG